MKQVKLIIKKCKGSSLIAALLVMVVLVLLGHAITVVSLSTLKSNVSDTSNNEAYYAAESAVSKAVEHLKYEVVAYYQNMANTSDATQYGSLYNNFAENISSCSQLSFAEPELIGSSTNTTFSVVSHDIGSDIFEFLIESVSLTHDNSKYQVDANVYVKRVDIRVSGGRINIPDNAALIVGGLMDLDYDSGIGVNGGDVIVAGITYESLKKNSVPYNISGGDLFIDPNIGDIITDSFVYPSYVNPTINDPDILASADMTINWSNAPSSPAVITSLPGVDLTLSCNLPDGLVCGKGNVTVVNGTYGVEVYCDGDLYLESCTFEGDIYCRGSFTGSNAVIKGNLYCDGNVNWTSGYSVGNIVSGGNVIIRNASSVCSIAAAGNVEIESVGINAGLIYSSGNCTIGNCSVSAVLYSYGDIVITGGMYLQGAIVAKQDFYFSNPGPYMNMSYSASFVQEILDKADEDLFNNTGGTTPTLDSSIFVSDKITPIGRVN